MSERVHARRSRPGDRARPKTPTGATPEVEGVAGRGVAGRGVVVRGVVVRLPNDMAADALGGNTVEPSLAQRLTRRKGTGRALPSGTVGGMEDRLSADFSRVRVHDDSEADTMAHHLQATAFTLGEDIYFRQGAFAPGTGTGKRVLAHELSHVAQHHAQRNGTATARPVVGRADDPAEREADRMADAVMGGSRVQSPTVGAPGTHPLALRRTKQDEWEKVKVNMVGFPGRGVFRPLNQLEDGLLEGVQTALNGDHSYVVELKTEQDKLLADQGKYFLISKKRKRTNELQDIEQGHRRKRAKTQNDSNRQSKNISTELTPMDVVESDAPTGEENLGLNDRQFADNVDQEIGPNDEPVKWLRAVVASKFESRIGEGGFGAPGRSEEVNANDVFVLSDQAEVRAFADEKMWSNDHYDAATIQPPMGERIDVSKLTCLFDAAGVRTRAFTRTDRTARGQKPEGSWTRYTKELKTSASMPKTPKRTTKPTGSGSKQTTVASNKLLKPDKSLKTHTQELKLESPASQPRPEQGKSSQKGAMKISALDYASSILGDSAREHNWEWLHLIGRQLGGKNEEGNLVAGTWDANTAMMPLEDAIKERSKDATLVERTRPLTVKATAELVPGTWVAKSITLQAQQQGWNRKVGPIRITDQRFTKVEAHLYKSLLGMEGATEVALEPSLASLEQIEKG